MKRRSFRKPPPLPLRLHSQTPFASPSPRPPDRSAGIEVLLISDAGFEIAAPLASAVLATTGSADEEGLEEPLPDRDVAQTIAPKTRMATSTTGPHPDEERSGGRTTSIFWLLHRGQRMERCFPRVSTGITLILWAQTHDRTLFFCSLRELNDGKTLRRCPLNWRALRCRLNWQAYRPMRSLLSASQQRPGRPHR